MLALAAFLVLTFAVVGWYLDWYHVQPTGQSENGHQTISIDINKRKIIHDVKQGEKQVNQALESRMSDGQSPQHAGDPDHAMNDGQKPVNPPMTSNGYETQYEQ
jgi:hypothetical protein